MLCPFASPLRRPSRTGDASQLTSRPHYEVLISGPHEFHWSEKKARQIMGRWRDLGFVGDLGLVGGLGFQRVSSHAPPARMPPPPGVRVPSIAVRSVHPVRSNGTH
eukprot:8980367-Pyramimonas_sp.AAC.1